MFAVAADGGGTEIGVDVGAKGVEEMEGVWGDSSCEEGDSSELPSGHSFSSVADNFLFISYSQQ